jgi:hypothetical protein
MSSITKVEKMFTSVIKRSRILIFTQFAEQIKDKNLSKDELYDIIENLFTPTKHIKTQKLTAYKLFLAENPDIHKSELKITWMSFTSIEKQEWKNRVLAIKNNNIQKTELIYNEERYLIDDENVLYDYTNERELGYYDEENDNIQFNE